MPKQRLIEFDCECGAEDCTTAVLMTLAEWNLVERRRGRWIIAPGHTLADGDRLLEQHERYWVVSGPGAEVVEQLASGDERLIDYGCECGAAGCNASVSMTFSERDTVDHVPDRWAVAPGHLRPGDELLEQHERYWVVAGRG